MDYEDRELIEHESGLKIWIGQDIYDTEFHDPRSWDNVGIMYCWHPDYILGDDQFSRGEFNSLEEVYDYIKTELNGICILPLCIYEHSGITMYIGQKGDYPFDAAGWDTTACGFIYTTNKKISDHFKLTNASEEEVEEILRQEVSVYASYLEGEIYQYWIEDNEGHVHDACGGYVGSYDSCVSDAKAAADSCAQAIEREKNEERHWLARGVITI